MGTLDLLIENLVLLPDDRVKLHGRGFTDEIISRYGFRSCQPDNVRALKDLEKRTAFDELAKELLYVPDAVKQGLWVANPQLLEPNILIPYYNKDGLVEKVRPHFFGFKGQPAMVYQTESSFKKSLICIIAESEFKAIAAEAFGYAAIGVPGITSMSGKNWDYFSKVLDSIVAEEFVICFDNEIKDNPEFAKHNPKRYKADWRKRYDTFIYAYAMATKILDHGRNCKIATLPTEWMDYGKIDIDAALAQRRTTAEFTQVINAALPTKKYLKLLPVPDRHRPWINKRIRCFFHKSQVEIKGNEFWSLGKTDPKTHEREEGKRLTNCHWGICNMYEMNDSPEDGLQRDIRIVDEYGIESKLTPLYAEQMTSKHNLSTWLMSQGNYLFYGTDREVTSIWEHVFNHDESNIVYMLNRCGHIREYGFWIFNGLIIKDGKAYPADEAGICWLDEIGYKIRKTNEVTVLPTLTPNDTFDIKTYISYLSDTCDIELPGLGKALVAWVLSVVFSNAIFDKMHMFPILNFYGLYGGGKTTVMRWLLAFFGDHTGTLVKSLKNNSTVVGIARMLDYYSSLPFVAEDWRSTPECERFLPMFLGVYGRQGGVKGVRDSFGTKDVNIRAVLAILGEDMINDGGVMSRCLSFHFPNERIHERLEELNEMAPLASGFMYDVLLRYNELEPKVLNAITDAVKEIESLLAERTLTTAQQSIKTNRRVMFNYAILLGTYRVLIDPDDQQIKEFVISSILGHSVDLSVNNRIHQFAEEFLFGVTEGYLQAHHYKFEGNNIVLWIKGIHDVMNKFYNRSNDYYKLLLKLLMQRKYFVKPVKASFQGVRGKLPAVVLSLDAMPEQLKSLFEGARDDPRVRLEETGS